MLSLLDEMKGMLVFLERIVSLRLILLDFINGSIPGDCERMWEVASSYLLRVLIGFDTFPMMVLQIHVVERTSSHPYSQLLFLSLDLLVACTLLSSPDMACNYIHIVFIRARHF
jgi:hypothetical protein